MNTANEPPLGVIRASGLYDAVILLPFALPGVSAWALAKLDWANDALRFTGSIPEMSGLGLMFCNMMAALAILYSILLIRQPNRFYGMYDVVARFLMGGLIAVYLVAYGVAGIFWVFVAIEAFWLVAQYTAVVRSAGNRVAAG